MTTPGICIVQPALGKASETFIAAHAERLPADVTVIHHTAGSLLPQINGRPALSQQYVKRGLRKAKRLLAQKSWDWEITEGYIQGFRKAGAQAVLAEYGTMGVRVLEACRVAGLPLIVHFHGFDASKQDVLDAHQAEYSQLFQQAAAVIAVSWAMQEKLFDLGATHEKVHYNPYGVDFERFRPARPADNAPDFLAVGRFVEKKAPYLTLLAFQQVLQECGDARLKMIGEGPLLGPCKDLAQALCINHSVEFLGVQSHHVVATEMQRARGFVQHSIEASSGDCEGTPNSVLEAGASGLPVVSTRHAGIPDVVVEGETGFLVDERDVAGMAGHMIQLAREPQLAASLGSAARRRIESNFSMDRSIGRLWEIIEACIEGRSPDLNETPHQEQLPQLA